MITIRLCDDSAMRLRASPVLPRIIPARDVPDDGLLYAASAALGSPEPQSRSHALSAALKKRTTTSRVRRDAAWALGDIGPAAHDAVPALVAALKDNVAEVRRAAAAALEKLDPAAARLKAQFAEQAPEGSKEPTDLTLAGEGLKGCGDSGLLIQATHNHVSSCGFQFRGATPRKHDSPDFFVLSPNSGGRRAGWRRKS